MCQIEFIIIYFGADAIACPLMLGKPLSCNALDVPIIEFNARHAVCNNIGPCDNAFFLKHFALLTEDSPNFRDAQPGNRRLDGQTRAAGGVIAPFGRGRARVGHLG